MNALPGDGLNIVGLVNVGVEQMDSFMKERFRVYTGTAKQLGLAK